MCMLCFVIINSVVLNRACLWIEGFQCFYYISTDDFFRFCFKTNVLEIQYEYAACFIF